MCSRCYHICRNFLFLFFVFFIINFNVLIYQKWFFFMIKKYRYWFFQYVQIAFNVYSIKLHVVSICLNYNNFKYEIKFNDIIILNEFYDKIVIITRIFVTLIYKFIFENFLKIVFARLIEILLRINWIIFFYALIVKSKCQINDRLNECNTKKQIKNIFRNKNK